MRFTTGALLVLLAGCQDLQMQFKAPPPANRKDDIVSQAKEGYQYFALYKTVIIVGPADELGLQTKAAPASGGGAASKGDSAPPAPVRIGQGPTPASPASGNAAAPAAKASQPAAPANTGPQRSEVPDEAANKLASGLIDGKVWAAAAVPVADGANAFMVRGVSGFWQKTTLSIAYYQNTDIPASISSTAENLFPKRVEQITGIVSSLVSLGAMMVSTAEQPLAPFKLEVPADSMKAPAELQPGWTYEFQYEQDGKPDGTLNVAQFRDAVKDQKVPYWPVPACRTARLTLAHGRAATYVFYLTVSSSDALRLQPLPVAGKTDLGTICNASVTGQTAADPLADLGSNMAALQTAAKKLASPPANASSGAAPGAKPAPH